MFLCPRQGNSQAIHTIPEADWPHRTSSYGGSRVAVVIATHEESGPLEACLASYLSMVKKTQDVIFIDNGSHSLLSKWVSTEFPGITTLRLPKNLMFCGGYNLGIRIAMERGYDFVLISNADTEVVNSKFITELLGAAQRWPQGAFFGPQVFWKRQDVVQKTCLQFPSVFRSTWQWIPWRFYRGYFERQPRKEASVEFLNGVCVLCRVKALREIGLMDENMGGYVEDADWAWRAREKGWVSVFTPVPSVVHHEFQIGYEPFSVKTFLLKRNTVYWYLKIGRRHSAWSYAKASVALALARLLAVHHDDERQQHRYFLRRLTRAFKGLLRREPLGEWFGPPHGIWN